MIEKRITHWLAETAIQHRWIVIITFIVATALSLVAADSLDIVADPEDLLGEDNPVSRQFFELGELFGMSQSLLVAVEGDERDAMVSAAHDVADGVRADEDLSALFRAISLKNDSEFAMRWALMLADEIEDIEDTQRLLEQRSLQGLLTVLNDTMEDVAMSGDDEFRTNEDEWRGLAAMDSLEQLALALGNSPDETPEETSSAVTESMFAGAQYNWAPGEDMLLFSLFPSYSEDDFEAMRSSVEGVQAVIDEVSPRYEGVELSIGGEVAWGVARHEALGTDTLIPTLVALVLILVLFFFSFTRLRKITLAVLALSIGIILSMGAIALTIGHISLITSTFAVILLGLGIDFGIHLVSNHDDFQLSGMSTDEALRATMQTGGTPILLGGITTACAFLSLMISNSPAIFEFGFVAGIGVLITLFTMLLLLPALITAFAGKGSRSAIRGKPMVNFSFMGALGGAIQRRPVIALTGAAVLTVFAVGAIPRNTIDFDPMNNSPRNHSATRTQERIMDKMRISPFTSMLTSDSIDELRETSERFRRERVVARVISPADFLPPADEVDERLDRIAAGGPAGFGISDDAAGFDSGADEGERTADDVQALAGEIQRLEWNVIELGDLAVAGLGEQNMLVERRDAMIREIFGAEVGAAGREVFQNAIARITDSPEAYASRLAEIDAAVADTMEQLQRQMSVDRAPTVDDLPADIREQMVSEDGTRFLAMVFPTAATQESSESVRAFHTTLNRIEPRVTGSIPLYVELIEEIFGEATTAAIYVAIIVFVLLFVIFRRVSDVLTAFLMVALGIVWMFGLLPFTGTELALTAGLVLPLLIGIGTDDAMHILHRYRHEGGDIVPTLQYTGKAVLLTSITTMLGFGSLALIGEMATIAAIGWLLFVGIGTCFLATVVVLPALLEIGRRRGGTGSGGGT